ncbi:hypothetical protein EAH89_03935 [Roseomonas nepalensis]|uniref:MAPEG family protein n=1 Tax=Muricoccus nepalensis TaxID=1854500 RepID=A0A502GF51_9PROT|nr:MAPEG family protein [Roseomonas nepalensis]TPG60525.1 hypothetical protein EAH89_03935 [Roseomonas nepalensis]
MTPELRWLALGALLGLAQILAAAVATIRQREGGLAWAAGPRDTAPPPPQGVAARLTRARDNFLETFPLFVAAVAAAQLSGRAGAMSEWGALLYVLARVAYVPTYALGLAVRPVVWGVSILGLLMVLAAALLG